MRYLKAVLLSSALLIGCSSLNPVSLVSEAISPSKGIEATAQVGENNTKQGIGITATKKQTQQNETGDISGGKVTNTTAQESDVVIADLKADTAQVSKQDQKVDVGTVTAKTVQVSTNNSWTLPYVVTIGFLSILAVITWLVPSPLRNKNGQSDQSSTGDSG